MSKEMTIDDLQELLTKIRAQHGNLVIGTVGSATCYSGIGEYSEDVFSTIETVKIMWRNVDDSLTYTTDGFKTELGSEVAVIGAY